MAIFGLGKKKKIEKKAETKVKEVKKVKEAKKEDTVKKENKKVSKKVFNKNPELVYKIIIKPIITEKATNLSAENKYIFEVAKDANKIEVKKAIQALYGINPKGVNIIKIKGKNVRYGKATGTTKSIKKAIVTLNQGDKIDIFEN